MKKFSIALAALALFSAGSAFSAEQMMVDPGAKMPMKDSAKMKDSMKKDSMKKEPMKMDEKKSMMMKKEDKQ